MYSQGEQECTKQQREVWRIFPLLVESFFLSVDDFGVSCWILEQRSAILHTVSLALKRNMIGCGPESPFDTPFSLTLNWN